MAIELNEAHRAAIAQHGEETFPNECCGFMLGKLNGTERGVTELLRAANDREDASQYNRFLITPEAYMRGEKAARAKGLDIVGFYHSHPNAPARPSQYDLDHAWPVYSYVIVSIKDGTAADMTSWRLKDDRSAFDPEEIRIGT
jgi:proteasome lid subunit RPN8/RPN11